VALSSSNLARTEIESALADYLPASFLDSPVIGADLGPRFGLTTSYIRTLANANAETYKHLASNDDINRGAVWAAALWVCREQVGQKAVDGLVLPAWRRAMGVPSNNTGEFRKALMEASPPIGACFSTEFSKLKLVP
jgi:hypothetical protein